MGVRSRSFKNEVLALGVSQRQFDSKKMVGLFRYGESVEETIAANIRTVLEMGKTVVVIDNSHMHTYGMRFVRTPEGEITPTLEILNINKGCFKESRRFIKNPVFATRFVETTRGREVCVGISSGNVNKAGKNIVIISDGPRHPREFTILTKDEILLGRIDNHNLLSVPYEHEAPLRWVGKNMETQLTFPI